jgi:hypothetical protein
MTAPKITESQIRYWVNVECLSAGEIASIIGRGCRKEHVFKAAKKYGVSMAGKTNGFKKGKKDAYYR